MKHILYLVTGILAVIAIFVGFITLPIWLPIIAIYAYGKDLYESEL